MIHCQLVARQGADLDIAAAAQVKPVYEGDHDKAKGIINFMMREHHGSPFEHAYLKFIVEAPIFVSREHFRHRIGHSYNEISTRYTDIRKAGRPYIVRGQQQIGKTGAYRFEDLPDDARKEGEDIISAVHEAAESTYDRLIALGYGKQDAGTVFPISFPTRYVWSCNPRSLMHFLNLRNAPQARREIRMVAEQAERQFAQCFPWTYEAFVEHGRIAP